MSKAPPNFDVFLATRSSNDDAGQVAEALREGGLKVFVASEMTYPGQHIDKAIWEALAESVALVMVLSGADDASSSWLAVELGAAMAWQKPIYVLGRSPKQSTLPAFLTGFKVHSLSSASKIAEEIKRGSEPLTDTEREVLIGIYQDLRIPTDQLSRTPSAVDKLTKMFRKVTGEERPAERLLSELLRLRKSGRLPSLRPRKG